jgi:hypothetical protein
METVESQWNIQDINWEKGLINGSDMEQIVDMFRKQLSELTKKHSILQERLEELKRAAFKKEESFSDRQELTKLEDELQLVKVRNLGEETCEIVESTKTEDHVDVLLQVEDLEQQHQIDEVSAVENSSQVQLQQASEITMIADAVYNESQIGLEMEMKDDKDVEAHVTQWQELKQHDIVQQRQEQELTEIIKKSHAKIMAEEDHNFRHGAERARLPQYTHHQYLGWQECDGGLKKMSRRH